MLLNSIKFTPRTGWMYYIPLEFPIRNIESVSAHSFKLALMTILLPESIKIE